MDWRVGGQQGGENDVMLERGTNDPAPMGRFHLELEVGAPHGEMFLTESTRSGKYDELPTGDRPMLGSGNAIVLGPGGHEGEYDVTCSPLSAC